MDSKTTSIVTYLTLVGFIISLAAGTKDEFSAQHMNNMLVNMLFSLPVILGWVPILGWILDLWVLFVGVCTIIGFIMAIQGKPFETPLIGKIKIIKA
ncbi:MAG: hypothetical protein J6X97_06870 [Lachnospiraceae bacterium]|nr:hypothetical protein [Lachnospiraceae bacterium]